MKQLLIVNSVPALNGGATAPNNLSTMAAGSIGFWYLGTNAFINTKPTKNFGIALARGNNSPAIVIPEVDVKTLTASIMEYAAGTPWSSSITIPATADGSTYTLVLVKKGVVPHERNTWTATETVYDNTKQTAAVIANKLGTYFQRMADAGGLDVSVTISSTTITITSTNNKVDWELKPGDDLFGVTVNNTPKADTVCDKAYIQDLAQQCAAGKGFTDTYRDGDTIYPGYPEAVENAHYGVLTLRFAVGRASAKTRDERVYQLVHIACPMGGESELGGVWSTLKTMFADYVTEDKKKS